MITNYTATITRRDGVWDAMRQCPESQVMRDRAVDKGKMLETGYCHHQPQRRRERMGLETWTRLEPQACFFFCISFYFTNIYFQSIQYNMTTAITATTMTRRDGIRDDLLSSLHHSRYHAIIDSFKFGHAFVPINSLTGSSRSSSGSTSDLEWNSNLGSEGFSVRSLGHEQVQSCPPSPDIPTLSPNPSSPKTSLSDHDPLFMSFNSAV